MTHKSQRIIFIFKEKVKLAFRFPFQVFGVRELRECVLTSLQVVLGFDLGAYEAPPARIIGRSRAAKRCSIPHVCHYPLDYGFPQLQRNFTSPSNQLRSTTPPCLTFSVQKRTYLHVILCNEPSYLHRPTSPPHLF